MKRTLLAVQNRRDTDNAFYAKNAKSIQAKRKALRNTTVRGRMSVCLQNSKQRAKKIGKDNDLTIEFLCALWSEQDGMCAVSGRELSLETGESRIKSDLVSIDRINSDGDYTQDNVWLVVSTINYAKGIQTYEEFVAMCKQVVENYNEA